MRIATNATFQDRKLAPLFFKFTTATTTRYQYFVHWTFWKFILSLLCQVSLSSSILIRIAYNISFHVHPSFSHPPSLNSLLWVASWQYCHKCIYISTTTFRQYLDARRLPLARGIFRRGSGPLDWQAWYACLVRSR